MMKTALITGGAGFLGSHVSGALLEQGFRVLSIDNLAYGDMRNLAPFIHEPQFTFYERDILDKPFLMDISRGVDVLLHFATYKIPREEGCIKTIEVNTKGTETILDVARDRKLRVIFGSTDDVYGKNPELPFSEESALVIGNPKSIRWSDAISKLYSEQL